MNIDWSKAPADATHARTHKTGIDFYKRKDCGQWSYWGSNGQWVRAFATSEADCVERPKPWTGEGLPPVGTVCEQQTWVNREWRTVTVAAHFNNFAVCVWEESDGDSQVELAPPGDLRPIRTAEQIAAEEHERQIVAMEDAIFTAMKVCEPYENSRRKVAEMVVAAGFVREERKP